MKQNENGTVLKMKRSPKCFITHTPYPKFCRWAKTSVTKDKVVEISKDLKHEIRKHIERIERKECRLEDLIINAMSSNKDFGSQFPDLVLEKNRKLRGGAKEETIKQFISKTERYNTVLN